MNESFLLLFFKKEALAFFIYATVAGRYDGMAGVFSLRSKMVMR